MSRTPSWVRREYGEEKWPAAGRALAAALRADPSLPLAHAVERVARAEWAPGPPGLTAHDACLGGRRVRIPRAVALGAWRACVVEAVLARCDPAPDLILELGSGWGRNLLDIWRCGGPPDARYVGAELTAAGRAVADRLAALAPALRWRSLSFDLTAPDLSDLGRCARAVVFTAYATEQVPTLERSLIAIIAGVAAEVVCVHLEDVGWQLTGTDTPGSSEGYARAHDYNRNLVSVLREAERVNLIELVEARPDVVGVNPQNAASIIVWRTPTAAAAS